MQHEIYGLKCDREGRIYVATNMGIQVLDQTGRMNAILKIPPGTVSNCCFGEPDFNVLYITCGDKVYKKYWLSFFYLLQHNERSFIFWIGLQYFINILCSSVFISHVQVSGCNQI